MAIFTNLAEKLQAAMSNLKRHGKLTEKDVDAALREVRLALLEADVNYKVVKDFVARVKERAIGQEVLSSLSPAQQVIKIVRDELTELMGGQNKRLELASRPPTVIMMVGLQGAGKTTTSAKLALQLKKQGHRPLLVAGDVYRPAAIKQLMVLGDQIDVPVFQMGDKISPVDIAKAGVEHAKTHNNDVVLLDTAGRLHTDEALMQELSAIKEATHPHQILLLVDAMTGQDAVNVAQEFDRRLDVSGVILTRLDGDARGGAALSIRAVTGKPIMFAAMGEKLDALEPFYPERIASRILGMGDVLSLIEKAEATIDETKAKEMAERLKTAEFGLDDFLEQMKQLRSMGPLDQLMEMIPGMSQVKGMKGMEIDEKRLKHIEAIILSMTPRERRNPSIIDGSRKRRIAAGSGTKVQDVNRLLKQFRDTKQMVKQLGVMDKAVKKRRGLFKLFQ